MPITAPPLDNRSYQDLVKEAVARIPVHTPEWTNFNDSDPGMTLVQLFAYLTDSILYRANQIPDRNRLKFLSLLGIGVQPATSATGFVTVQNERGPLETRAIGPNLDVRAGAARFRTLNGLDVLPLEAQAFIKEALPEPQTEEEAQERETYRVLFSDLLDSPGTTAAFYRTTPLPAPIPGAALPAIDIANGTADGCLWIALLARPSDLRRTPAERLEDLDKVRSQVQGRTLTLGVMPALAEEGIDVRPGLSGQAQSDSPYVWEIANPPAGGLLPPVTVNPAGRTASYQLLSSRSSTDILRRPGLVQLTLPAAVNGAWINLEPQEEGTGGFPPSLADTDVGDRVVTWIRLRLRDQSGAAGGVRSLVSWVGLNATWVEQKTAVSGEVIGEGTGEPDQQFALANTPLVPGSLSLTVNGEAWWEIDDLYAADSELAVQGDRQPVLFAPDETRGATIDRRKVFIVDPEAGLITFGNGAHGMRPRGRITAAYAFGGGIAGNVPAGAISRATDLPAGYKVANPIRTWGGSNAQTVSEAELTIPSFVRHKDQPVSLMDWEEITLRTPGVDIGRVEVLPLYDAYEDMDGVPGTITVVVIPERDPLQPDAPRPDRLFLETVCKYLEPRRLITTQLFIRGPRYRDVWLSLGLEVLGGHDIATVREAVRQRLREFLSPLTGGRDGGGWPLGGAVLEREIEAVTNGVPGVRFVNEVLLGGATGGRVERMELDQLELPRLVGVEVSAGPATPLDELRNSSPAPTNQVPIPIIPTKC